LKEFESKAALFALAVAEVLIVNLHFLEMGRVKSYELLKTVFQQALKMDITEGQKRTLLFLIRDYDFDSSLAKNEKSIKDKLEKVWSEIEKKTSRQKRSSHQYVF
jgi:hypothetical protein